VHSIWGMQGAQLSQIAISWLLHQKGLTSAIVGTQSEKHLIENIRSAGMTLSSDEREILNRISTKILDSL